MAAGKETQKKLEEKKITFLPDGGTISVASSNLSVGEIAARHNIMIDQPCGGAGTCGKCRVIVRNATSKPTHSELKILTTEELSQGYRLACQCPVEDGVIVSLPTQGERVNKLLKDRGTANSNRKLDPFIEKKQVKPVMPGVKDSGKSLAHIILEQIGLKNLEVSMDVLKELPALFSRRRSATAVFSEDRLLSFEDEEIGHLYGLAIDIGTTSLVVWLVDLSTGAVLEQASDINPQTAFGADVLSRISFAQKNQDGINILRDAVVESVNMMISSLALRKNISKDSIYGAIVAGNACMEHFALGVDPRSIGRSPFLPVKRSFPPVSASSMGLDINTKGNILMIPNISGYVGGDITAGIEATGMSESTEITLLVDIGTNNEIVLGNKDFLLACSAAAGPAFEGACISCGMRAETGAIERFKLHDGEIYLDVIGKTDPVGICGSGLIDIVAELVRAGLIDKSGKFAKTGQEELDRRFFRDSQGIMSFLFWEPLDSESTDLALTQKDVREVQLAKGAIATGTRALLDKAGLSVMDLDRVFVSGAFGNYLNRENAVSIGILPDLPVEKIHFAGNTAVAGACNALLSKEALEVMKRVVEKTEYIELSSLDNFQKLFLENLTFR